ncbi:MAG: hypothetical protein ACYC5Q_12305 [Thermoleophilia bacterium]
MDMTGWLEYFVEGPAAQLAEVRERGEQAIRRDVLMKEHLLTDRQAGALGHMLEHGSLTIQEFEKLSLRPSCDTTYDKLTTRLATPLRNAHVRPVTRAACSAIQD